jgi:hypothetical protein
MTEVVVKEVSELPNNIAIDEPIPGEAGFEYCVRFEQAYTKHNNCNGNKLANKGVEHIRKKGNLIIEGLL